jgi:hypothetical protein
MWQRCWLQDSDEQTADQAAASWAELHPRIGPQLERLPPDSRWRTLPEPYGVLGRKYFEEHNYSKAFEMDEQVLARSGSKPDFGMVYLAGLAGKEEWLKGLLGSEQQPLGDAFDRFVSANLAWIAGDDEEILRLTVPVSAPRRDESTKGRALQTWLDLMRAKGLARLEKYGEAFDVLETQFSPKWTEMMRSDVVGATVSEEMSVSVLMFCAQVEEKAGHLEAALRLAQTVRKKLEPLGARSWYDDRLEIGETIGRLKWCLAGN